MLVRSGCFRTPANLFLQALGPLVAAMVQMRALGEQSLMAAAGGNGGPSRCERVAELLAGDADHQGSAWTQLARLHGWPVGRFSGMPMLMHVIRKTARNA